MTGWCRVGGLLAAALVCTWEPAGARAEDLDQLKREAAELVESLRRELEAVRKERAELHREREALENERAAKPAPVAPATPAPGAAAPPVAAAAAQGETDRKVGILAEELEKELGEEAVVEEAGEISTPQGEVSLEEIFREFKKGVEQQLSAEDYETHYNLAIAYKEMGLTDEAIGEFQFASKSPAFFLKCCSMLGICFREKGMNALAAKWYQKGLESAGAGSEEDALGLRYDLALLHEEGGEVIRALELLTEVYGVNAQYRDVADRIRLLGERRQTGEA